MMLSLTNAWIARPVNPSSWQLCGQKRNRCGGFDVHLVAKINAKYDVELKSVTIGPYPAVSGEDFTFIVPAITNEEIPAGSLVMSFTFHGVPIHVE